MEKKILISVATILIVLASVSTFYDFSKGISGEVVAPGIANVYVIFTALVLIGISVFVIFRKH